LLPGLSKEAIPGFLVKFVATVKASWREFPAESTGNRIHDGDAAAMTRYTSLVTRIIHELLRGAVVQAASLYLGNTGKLPVLQHTPVNNPG
jgi:hypothetical protein